MSVEPTTKEMRAAWEEYKATKLFAALVVHVDPKIILENEGFLWGIFYNGFMAGRKSCQ